MSNETGEMRLIASWVCLAFWDIRIQKCKKKCCTCRVIHLYSYSCFTQIQLYCHCKEYSLFKNSCIKISEHLSHGPGLSLLFIYLFIYLSQSFSFALVMVKFKWSKVILFHTWAKHFWTIKSTSKDHFYKTMVCLNGRFAPGWTKKKILQ